MSLQNFIVSVFTRTYAIFFLMTVFVNYSLAEKKERLSLDEEKLYRETLEVCKPFSNVNAQSLRERAFHLSQNIPGFVTAEDFMLNDTAAAVGSDSFVSTLTEFRILEWTDKIQEIESNIGFENAVDDCFGDDEELKALFEATLYRSDILGKVIGVYLMHRILRGAIGGVDFFSPKVAKGVEYLIDGIGFLAIGAGAYMSYKQAGAVEEIPGETLEEIKTDLGAMMREMPQQVRQDLFKDQIEKKIQIVKKLKEKKARLESEGRPVRELDEALEAIEMEMEYFRHELLE